MTLAASIRALPVLALALPAAAQRAASGWTEVATVECRGGDFVTGDFDASGDRLLTAGAEGDLILWDTRAGVALRHYDRLDCAVAAVRMHPREPWALVVGRHGWMEPCSLHVLRLDTSSCSEVARLALRELEFDAAGGRVALVAGFADPEALTFGAAAVLAGLLETPDRRVAFAGDDDELPDYPGTRARNGEWSARWDEGAVRRDGPKSGAWPLAAGGVGFGMQRPAPIVAADGTVAAIGSGGRLFLCGPGPGEPRVVRGHLAPPLQLVFATDQRTLAVNASDRVTFVDCRDGRRAELPWECSVVADRGGDFTLLREDAVWRYDAARLQLGQRRMQLGGGLTALVRLSNGGSVAAPFAWVEPRGGIGPHAPRVWLGAAHGVTDPDADADRLPAAVQFDDRRGATAIDRPVPTDAYSRMVVSALVPTDRAGAVLMAERLPPVWCGNSLMHIAYRGALRAFDADGRPTARRLLRASVQRLRMSPDARSCVLLPAAELVDARTLNRRGRAKPEQGWVDFAFLGRGRGVASDGERLVEVALPGMQHRTTDRLPPVCDVDRLAASTDGRLLATSAHGIVRVFAAAPR